MLEIAQHAREHLGTAHVEGNLVSLAPRRKETTHHRSRHPIVSGSQKERKGAAEGETAHADTSRIDQRVILEHVQAPR